MAKPKSKILSPKPEPAARSHVSNLTSQICIFVFAFLLYSNTLHHGFVMDDGAVVTNHTTVQKGFAGITELFGESSVYGSTKENFGSYRPFTMSLFAVEKQFFGNSASAFHFIQVLLYALLCVVIFLVLKKLLHSYSSWLPLIPTLIFAAHPVHTEVVANIKSADEVLSLLFGCLAIYFSINTKASSLILASVCFLASLFSKESAVTFILIIPLALYFFTGASLKQILAITAVHFTAILIYFLARNSALDTMPDGVALINNSLAGAGTLNERYATIAVIGLKYLGLLFYPNPLCWDYGYNQVPLVGFGDPMAILSALIYLSLGVFAVVSLFKRKVSSIQYQVLSISSFCILFFLITLSVSSNIFVLIGATMAERFLFTPSLGFCILIAFGMMKLLKIESLNFKLSTLNFKLIPFLTLLVLFSVKTWSRNKDWKTNLSLFAKGVEDCPNSYRTNTTFAWESVLAGEKETDPAKKKIHLQNAVNYYKKGLVIYPGIDADWYNYGVSNSGLGNVAEAMNGYEHALKLNPKHINSLFNLATVYLGKKDYANSLSCFLRLYAIQPDFMDVSFKIGLIYQLTEKPEQAIPYYETYLARNPANKDVITNLMILYKNAGDTEKTSYYMGMLVKLEKK